MENLQNLLKNIKENKPLFISIITFLILVIASLLLYAVPSIMNPDNVYNDPLSGETIYNPADRTPEVVDSEKEPNFLGFSALVDRGIPFGTVQSLKSRLSNISIDKDKATEISIDINSIEHSIADNLSVYEFKIRINRNHDYGMVLEIKSDDTFDFALSGPGIDRVTF